MQKPLFVVLVVLAFLTASYFGGRALRPMPTAGAGGISTGEGAKAATATGGYSPPQATGVASGGGVSGAPPFTAPIVTASTSDMLGGGVDVTFVTTDGPFVLTLWPKLAPKHVEQVLRLARAGIYDGSVIFRVEKGFVIQFGGTYERPGALTPAQQAEVKPLAAEFSDVKHGRGTVSMARNDDPNSADSSFSILLGPAPHLDGHYTVFGQMHAESEETLRRVEAEAVTPGTTHPEKPITVLKVEVK